MNIYSIRPPVWLLIIAFTPVLSFMIGLIGGSTQVIWLLLAPQFLLAACMLVIHAMRRGLTVSRLVQEMGLYHKITFGVIFVAIILSEILVVPVGETSLRLGVYIIMMSCAFVLYHMIEDAPTLTRLFFLYSGIALAINFIQYAHWIYIADLPGDYDWGGFLATPGYLNVRHLAVTMPTISIGLLALGVFQRRVDWVYFTLAAIAMGFAIWTGTRAALFGYVAALPVFLIFGRDGIKLIVYALLVLAAAIPISYLMPASHEDLGLASMFSQTMVGSVSEASSGRLDIWQFALDYSLKRPIIGHGIDQFAKSAAERGMGPLHAHNGVLTYLHALGYPGAIAITAWMVFAWVSFGKAAHKSAESMAIFAGITVFFAFAMLAGLMYHATSLMVLFTLLAFGFANLTQIEK